MPPSDTERRKIAELSKFVSKKNLAQATLALRGCGVPRRDVETVVDLASLYNAIEKNSKLFPGFTTFTVLLCLLREARVDAQAIKWLGGDDSTLNDCCSNWTLSLFLLSLLREITNDEFRNLKDLGQILLKTHPDDITTLEKFFHLCLDQRLFEEEETLREFKGWLESIEREDLAFKVKKYIEEKKKKGTKHS